MQKFKEKLKYEEIIKLIPDFAYNTFHPEKVDHELIELKVSDVNPRGLLGDEKKANRYAKKDSDTSPPIIVDQHNKIIDGLHRWAAALKRGESYIKAYKPVANFKQKIEAAYLCQAKSGQFVGSIK